MFQERVNFTRTIDQQGDIKKVVNVIFKMTDNNTYISIAAMGVSDLTFSSGKRGLAYHC